MSYAIHVMKFYFLSPILLAALSLLTGCKCGYGGPGCGDPLLEGVCGVLVVGQPHTTPVEYSDDTSARYPTNLYTAKSKTPELLEVTKLDENTIELNPLAPGTAKLYMEIEHWDEPPVLDIKIVNMLNDLSIEERVEYDRCMEYSNRRTGATKTTDESE